MLRLKGFIYNIISLLVRLTPGSVTSKTLLIIKTNEIGDYILWRNMLPSIRKAKRFEGYRITLLGNIAWKNFFDTYDANLVDEVVWVNKRLFKENMKYRFSLLRKIRKTGFEMAANVVTSRCKREDDAFMLVLTNSYKVGSISDNTNILPFEKGYDNHLYNELLGKSTDDFEFFTNRKITEALIGEKLPDNLFELNAEGSVPAQLFNKNYFVVFTGASRPEKTWPADFFAEVANYVVKKYGLVPVLGGSPSDVPYVEAFLKVYKGESINLCGKTSLAEFAIVLNKARFLLSSDTGAVHIAAAVGCTVFGVFNGTRYGRFAPYPVSVAPHYHAVFPDEVENDVNNGNRHLYQGISPIPYTAIPAEKMIKTIERYFNPTIS